MVKYFQKALGSSGKVICGNNTLDAAGMNVGNHNYLTYNVNDPKYKQQILDICDKEDIALVVPLFDIDLKYLTEIKCVLETKNVITAVSKAELINIANDKFKTYTYLSSLGFLSPKTYLELNHAYSEIEKSNINFPLIVKPRFGMGSISVNIVNNFSELEFHYHSTKLHIEQSYLNMMNKSDDSLVVIQELMHGHEYGLDLLHDFNGQYIHHLFKKKVAMRSGETDIAFTFQDEEMDRYAMKLSSLLGHYGNCDIDMIRGTNGKIYIIDINPRFGGGYPFTHNSNCNYVNAYISILKNEPIEPFKPIYNKKLFKDISILSSPNADN